MLCGARLPRRAPHVAPVQFDYQLRLEANEIHGVDAARLLPAELPIPKAFCAQSIPKLALASVMPRRKARAKPGRLSILVTLSPTPPPSRGKGLFFEIVGVQFLQFQRRCNADADLVIDHQRRQFDTVDQHDS